MKISLIIIFIFLLNELWETEALTGEVGQQITIKCSHSYADTNVKYFCKVACYDEDVLITSRKADSSGKYSIKNEGNTFYVTILDLKLEDSGTYWCGIERVGVDTYVQVILTVKKSTEEQNPGDYLKSLGSQKLAFIGAGLGLVLVAVLVIVLLFFRLRKRHVSTSEREDDIEVETPFAQNKGPHCGSITSSVNMDKQINRIKQHQKASRNASGIIHSKVCSEPQIHSDDMSYSTVSFSKHPDCSGVPPQTDSVTYASVKHKSKSSCNV